MTIVAVGMVKDEADVIEATVVHLLEEAVDRVIVADNGSTDGTRDILADLAKELPVTVVDDPEVGYYQSRKITALAHSVHATWVVPFDADEVWCAPDRLGVWLRELPRDVHGVAVDLFDHFCTALDEPGLPFEAMRWRRALPAHLPKVAVRQKPGLVIEQGNHSARVGDNPVHLTSCSVQIRHFPYRSAEQFVRKARNGADAYRATDLPEGVGAHWRQYGDLLDRFGEDALRDVFREHFWYLAPVNSGLIEDPAPWCRWPS